MIDPAKGYDIKKKDGTWNLNKFVNVLDYSLDLIQLRELYLKIVRNKRFTFWENGKEYCPFVINVTFKYNDKLFNKQRPGVYVRSGYRLADKDFHDGVCVRDGVLLGVMTDRVIQNPLSEEELEKCFVVKADDDGACRYKAKVNIPILHSVRDLRTELYTNGFMFDGRKFVRFKRSSGSSRIGKCLFIDERLYNRMHQWEMCGIEIDENNPVDLAALEAYIALTLSSIVDTIQIRPDEILMIDDFVSQFEDKVIVTDAKDGVLHSYPDTIPIENSIWDGQSLIDVSLCPDHGMSLLRNRFFKSCCFSTNIQQFFEDHGITDVSQLNGCTRATRIEQIKLITTPSSIKYLKFGTLDQWLDNLDPTFGVVKHEKKTHFFDGELVQTHYQLINTLQMSQEEIDQFLEDTIRYIKALRYQPEVLRNHIKYPPDYTSYAATCQNDVVFALMGINQEFCKTKVYYNFMRNLLRSFVKNARHGHILVHGNYSTLFGNPYEMLLQTIGKFDGTPHLPVGCIHSTNFEYDKTILGSRSPHVCMGNIWLPHNVSDEKLDLYFNLSEEIVCINSINENVLQRLNGCDFDSDTVMLTDNHILITAAQKNYNKFLVPTSAVEAKKTRRYYTNEEKADLDIKTSENKIGEIINLAQRINTLLWHNLNNGKNFEENMELYCDVSKLSVLSGIEIDKAKKEFEIDVTQEIEKIKNHHFPKSKGERTIKPNFFGVVSRSKGYYNPIQNHYAFHDTSMDYLQHSLNRVKIYKPSPDEVHSLQEVLVNIPYDQSKCDRHTIRTIINKLNAYNSFVSRLLRRSDDDFPPQIKHQLRVDGEQAIIDFLSGLKMNTDTVVGLLRRADQFQDAKRAQILILLFASKSPALYDLLYSQRTKMPELVRDPDGDIEYYGIHFSQI